jgi:hypothetical protein
VGWTARVSQDSFSDKSNSFLCKVWRVLDPTEPPMQWIPGAVSLGVKLMTHICVALRLKTVKLYLDTYSRYLNTKLREIVIGDN